MNQTRYWCPMRGNRLNERIQQRESSPHKFDALGSVCDRFFNPLSVIFREPWLVFCDIRMPQKDEMCRAPRHPWQPSSGCPVYRADAIHASHHSMSSRSGGGFSPAGIHLISPVSFPSTIAIIKTLIPVHHHPPLCMIEVSMTLIYYLRLRQSRLYQEPPKRPKMV